MNTFLLFLVMMSLTDELTIFDFTKQSDVSNWVIVDDTVMGGRSQGSFDLDTAGHGVFTGEISLDNYGGFSSVRYRLLESNVNANSVIILTIKGDGKKYNLRIKDKINNYYSYTTEFYTTGEWEKVELLVGDMYPTFRGRQLNMPNFSSPKIEEIVFLFGNKKAESFELVLDKIEIRKE